LRALNSCLSSLIGASAQDSVTPVASAFVGTLTAQPLFCDLLAHTPLRELVFQPVPGSVRGSPNRGITLASKPVNALMRSSAIVMTCSP
jgi:hypothetical protein